jgi:hypothetical protein
MKRLLYSGAVAIGLLASTTAAHATLTLTAAGISDGFLLTTFATIDPGNTGFGPFGLAVNNNNQAIVSDTLSGNVYIFSDVDGQTPASALHTRAGAATGTVGMTATGGFYYGAAPGNGNFGGSFTRYNADGTVNSTLSSVSPPLHPYLGMAATPTGHIIATTDSGQLVDITPGANAGAGSSRLIATPGTGFDGVSVNAAGTQAIIENSGTIQVYDIATGALLHTYSPGNSPDGTGVISGGPLSGQIIANGNNGSIVLIDPAGSGGLGSFTTIASGGTRGDYTAADPNGTLLLDYSDIVARLSCGTGCSIGGGGTPTVPEPITLSILGTGLLGLALARRSRRG